MKVFVFLVFIIVIAGGAYYFYLASLSTTQDFAQSNPNASNTKPFVSGSTFLQNLGDDPGTQDIVFAVNPSIGQKAGNIPLGVYTVQKDGTHIFHVTKKWEVPKASTLTIIDPIFSPNGKYIAFRLGMPSGGVAIYVVPAQGGEVLRVMPEAQLGPLFSWLDGDHLLVIKNAGTEGSGAALKIGTGPGSEVPVSYSVPAKKSAVLAVPTTQGFPGEIIPGNGFYMVLSYPNSISVELTAYSPAGEIIASHVFKNIMPLPTPPPSFLVSPQEVIWFLGKGGQADAIKATGYYSVGLDGAYSPLMLIDDGRAQGVGVGDSNARVWPNPKNPKVFLTTGSPFEPGTVRMSGKVFIYEAREQKLTRATTETKSGFFESGQSWSADGMTVLFHHFVIGGLGEVGVYTARVGGSPQKVVDLGNWPSWNPLR